MDRNNDDFNAFKRKLELFEKNLEINLSFQIFEEKNSFI